MSPGLGRTHCTLTSNCDAWAAPILRTTYYTVLELLQYLVQLTCVDSLTLTRSNVHENSSQSSTMSV